MRETPGMGMDCGSFGHEQSPRGAGPLGVILESEVAMNVVLVRPVPSQRAQDDAMAEVHAADANRLEKFRRGHLGSGRELFGWFGEVRPSSTLPDFYSFVCWQSCEVGFAFLT